MVIVRSLLSRSRASASLFSNASHAVSDRSLSFGSHTVRPYTVEDMERELRDEHAKRPAPDASERAANLYHEHAPKVIDADRSTNQVKTIDELRARAPLDVTRLIDTGEPPTMLSSELLVELIAAWRVRVMYGLALVGLLIFAVSRRLLEGQCEVLALGLAEQPFKQALRDVQIAKAQYIDALAAEVLRSIVV